MEITKKEIKLIIDTFEHHESNLESEWSVELDSDEKAFLNKLKAAINYTRCCTEFADGKCKPMVNADWTYLRCECGKRFEPKG